MEDKACRVPVSPSEKPEGICLWCGRRLHYWGDANSGFCHDRVAYGRCESCGSLGQVCALTPQELGQAYSKSYWVEDGNSSLLQQLAIWYQRLILAWDHGRFLRQELGQIKGKRLLEIGPGRGDFLRWAKAQGAEVMGWERSPQAVALLHSHGLAAESVVLEEVSQWPAPTRAWDVIVGFHVLEHLVSPAEVVAALLPRLAPQGVLVLQVPRIDSFQSRLFGRRWVGLDPPRHVTVPSLKGLRKLASHLNLEETGTKQFSLRDNAFHILVSLLPSIDPHRPGCGGLKLVWLLIGSWCLQPLAILEAFAGRGGTVMMAFRKTKLPFKVDGDQ
ncbi:MAG: class I SAM-dependent methyltransferase [bacterium]